MADERIEDISGGELTAPAEADLLIILDASDTTDDADGTAKRIKYENLFAYGEISVDSNATATTVTSASSDWSNKVQVDSFGTNGVSRNTTPDHTSDHITIDVAGVYFCNFAWSFSGGNSDIYSFAIFKNNGATQLSQRGTRVLNNTGDVGNASICCVASLSATDTIEVWCQNETVGADFTMEEGVLVVYRIG